MTNSADLLTESHIAADIRPSFTRVLENPGGGVYLANHSLGRPPDEMTTNLSRFAADWCRYMDDCWSNEHWSGEVDKFRAQIASLIGLSRADAVVPKTSAGQGLRAVLNSLPQNRAVNVVTTTGEFDSIDFILKTYGELGRARVSWCPPSGGEGDVPLFESASIVEKIRPDTDLVVVSAVFFTTGQILQGLAEVVAAAHRADALILVDAYHAVGVVPFDMESLDADFVIGGSYKYLRGGPGACYLAVHPRHLDDPKMRTLDTGWFAKKANFEYERPPLPEFAEGGDGWLESTPPIATAYQANPGIAFVAKTGVERLRRYNLELQAALRRRMTSHGIAAFTPSNPEDFGAFVLVPHTDAPGFCERLKNLGVTVDSRGGFVRFGPDVLNTSDEIDFAVISAAKAF